jgi:hypothetical protein
MDGVVTRMSLTFDTSLARMYLRRVRVDVLDAFLGDELTFDAALPLFMAVLFIRPLVDLDEFVFAFVGTFGALVERDLLLLFAFALFLFALLFVLVLLFALFLFALLFVPVLFFTLLLFLFVLLFAFALFLFALVFDFALTVVIAFALFLFALVFDFALTVVIVFTLLLFCTVFFAGGLFLDAFAFLPIFHWGAFVLLLVFMVCISYTMKKSPSKVFLFMYGTYKHVRVLFFYGLIGNTYISQSNMR